MKKGFTYIFCGEGKGQKTAAAIGTGVRAAISGKEVMMIEFLKGRTEDCVGFIQKLEPEIKLFRFERSEEGFQTLSEEQREEERRNIRNGLNFAKKVLTTQGCDVLILDELLGLPAENIVSWQEIRELIEMKDSEMDLVITGNELGKELWDLADEVTVMQMMKHKNEN